jgi:hypothetical protein
VVYRIADIKAFEQQQLRTRTDLPANRMVEHHPQPSPKTKRNSSRVYAPLRGNCIGYDKLRDNTQ